MQAKAAFTERQAVKKFKAQDVPKDDPKDEMFAEAPEKEALSDADASFAVDGQQPLDGPVAREAIAGNQPLEGMAAAVDAAKHGDTAVNAEGDLYLLDTDGGLMSSDPRYQPQTRTAPQKWTPKLQSSVSGSSGNNSSGSDK